MNLPEFSVKRPVTTLMIFAALAVLAGVAVTHLAIDLYPNIEPPAISVITVYPGASAKDVETKITRNIENELSIVNNLDEIRSTSKENMSIVTCQFSWSADINEAANDVRDRLEFAKANLPTDAQKPVIFKFKTSMFPVLVYSASASEHWPNLHDLVDKRVADPLKRVPGVGAVTIVGGLQRQINVTLDRDRLAAYDLTPQEVEMALESENVTLPAGSIKVGRSEYALRVPGEFQSPQEAGDVVVKRAGGRIVCLRDVAEIADGFKEQSMRVRADGQQALAFFVQKQSGTNTVQVVRDVEARLCQVAAALPSDVKVTLLESQADFIERSIFNLRDSALWGAVLVVLVTFLFLREPASSFIIAVTIPVSVLASLLFMRLLGYTVNTMSLFALAMASGMVVDDAVVVIENVTRFREGGRRAGEAARFGAGEVCLAVTASTTTTVVIFVPLFFLTGVVGILFNQLGAVITVALATSLFTALTLTPMMASVLFKRQIYIPKTYLAKKLFALGEKALAAVEDAYYAILGWALENRALVILAAILSLALAGAASVKIGSEFFPDEDVGNVRITAELPIDTRVEESDAVAGRIESIIRETAGKDLAHVFSRTGTSDEGFASVMGGSEGSNVIELTARLVSRRERARSSKDLASLLSGRIRALPGIVKLNVDAGNPMSEMLVAGARPLAVDIAGNDLDATDIVAGKVKSLIESVPGATDVSVSRNPGKPELSISIDRQKAATLGLSAGQVAQTLRTYFYGKAATEYREAGEEYDVYLRLRDTERSSVDDVRAVTVTNPLGRAVPLSNFATISQSQGPAEIERLNQERIVTVSAGVFGRSLGEVTGDVEKGIARVSLPPGVDLKFSGLVKEQRDSFRSLLLMLAIGVALVYMVMAAQFESLLHPFVIMFSVPFAFVGVAFFLYAAGYALSVVTFIGMVMLVGIVVKNAIVLVDCINLLRARGSRLNQAIMDAGKRRLRPVLITTITTLVGLLPLAFSTGEGSETMRPLGMTVIGGLSVSTLVTLVLIPVVYNLFESAREKKKDAPQPAAHPAVAPDGALPVPTGGD